MKTASDAVVLATSAIAFFAGISLLSSPKSVADLFKKFDKVEIQFPNLSWVENVQFSAEQKLTLPGEPTISEISFAKYLPKKPKKIKVAKAKKISNHAVALHEAPAIDKREIQSLKKEVDKITWSYASPVQADEEVGIVPFDLPPTDPLVEQVRESTSDASAEELLNLQKLNHTLRTQFEVAFNMIADPIDPIPVAPKTFAKVAPKRVNTHAKKISKKKPVVEVAQVAVTTQAAEEPKQPEKPKKQELETAGPAPQVALSAPLKVKTGPPDVEKTNKNEELVEEPIRISQAAPQWSEPTEQLPQLKEELPASPVYNDSAVNSPAPIQVTTQAHGEGKTQLVSQTLNRVTIQLPPRPVVQVARVSSEGGPSPAVPATPEKEKNRKPSGGSDTTVAVAGLLTDEGDGRVLMGANPEELADAAVSLQQVTPAKMLSSADHVEAFEWFTPIYGVTSQEVTSEVDPDGKGGRGWRVVQSKGYWPTYYWSGRNETKRNQPILSQTAAKLLGTLAQVGVQEQAGIVFGKISAGWGIELSGRAEPPLFLTAKNELVSSEDRSRERYFAFINVEPGAHLLYLTSGKPSEDFAVPVAVWSNGATHLDLSDVKVVTVLGQVLDAGGTDLTPLKGAEVRVVGQTKGKLSGRNGEFSLSGVWVVGNFPLIMEMRYGKEYIHRFRVLPENFKAATLYRIPAQQIDGWVSELEGGVSAEGGMILVAAPRMAAEHGADGLFPGLRVTSDRQSLAHETYTLSETGHLMVHRSLNETLSRYLSVQVPQGPVITQLQDKRGAIVRSEMVFAQPGVLNVVGPY